MALSNWHFSPTRQVNCKPTIFFRGNFLEILLIKLFLSITKIFD